MNALTSNEPVEVDLVVTKILKRMAAEPAYKLLLHRLLAFSLEPRTVKQIHGKMLSFPEMKTALHPPETLLAWLVDDGGIEAIPVDQEESKWQATDAGKMVVEQHGPAARLGQLLAKEPKYLEIYTQILAFCQTPSTTPEIDKLLRDNRAMENPKVYPSYFVEALEAAGGLEWDGKWRTSDAGRPFIA